MRYRRNGYLRSRGGTVRASRIQWTDDPPRAVQPCEDCGSVERRTIDLRDNGKRTSERVCAICHPPTRGRRAREASRHSSAGDPWLHNCVAVWRALGRDW